MRLQGIRIGEEVELDANWMELCRSAARIRHTANRKAGNANQAKATDKLRVENRGVIGEVAFAMMAGVFPWVLQEKWSGSAPDCTFLGVRLDVKHLSGDNLWVDAEQLKRATSINAYASVTTVDYTLDDEKKLAVRARLRFDGFCPRPILIEHGATQGDYVYVPKSPLMDAHQLCAWFESEGGYDGSREARTGTAPTHAQP